MAEVVMFQAVRGGTVRVEYMKFALSLKDLAHQLARSIPRAPRFADADLLEGSERHMAAFYKQVAQFLDAHDVASVSTNMTAARTCRDYLLTATQTVLFGAQRGQSVSRLQVEESEGCLKCGEARCKGNRIVRLDNGAAKLRVIISHHKNELARRTRVSRTSFRL